MTVDLEAVRKLEEQLRAPMLHSGDRAIDRLCHALERDGADTPLSHLTKEAYAVIWQLRQIAELLDRDAIADTLRDLRAEVERLRWNQHGVPSLVAERDTALARVKELTVALFEASGYARDPVAFAERFSVLIARKP